MSKYHCEGLIKEVSVKDGKVSFKMEPSAPYMFERKKADGAAERCLLLVEDKSESPAAMIISPSHELIPPKPSDLNTLLIAKANRMRAIVEAADIKHDAAIEVQTINIQ